MKKEIAIEEELQFLETEYKISYKSLKGILKFSFSKGEIFIKEGEPLSYLYFARMGKAKVSLLMESGKQLLPCYYISKGIIGDIEFMTEQKEAFSSMQALTDFVCIAIPIPQNEALLKENIAFMNLIGKGLAQKLMQSNTNSAINLLHSLEERLCAYIVQASYQGIFCEKLTDVATWLGTSYRHLLRILEKLCAEGILEKQKGMYLILDEQALTQRASEAYIQLCCKKDSVSG